MLHNASERGLIRGRGEVVAGGRSIGHEWTRVHMTAAAASSGSRLDHTTYFSGFRRAHLGRWSPARTRGKSVGVWLNKNSQVSTWYEASRPDQPRLSPQAKRRPRIRNVWRKLVKKREYVVQSWQGLQGPDMKVCYVLADGSRWRWLVTGYIIVIVIVLSCK
jgi:hypothetical protein